MSTFRSKRIINGILAVLFIVIVLVILAQFTLFKGKKLNSPANNKQIESQARSKDEKKINTNRIIVDFGDGRKIDQMLKADTPFKALEIVAGGNGYKIETKQYKYGLIVESRDKIKNSYSKFWLFSVNGEPAKISADRYILAPQDVVEWKYTSAK